ncbi:MAG: hypothetical protein HY099_00740 [Nitrospirae bacterium]|nr:hypothetical protein [Nitrospirota bacterium]
MKAIVISLLLLFIYAGIGSAVTADMPDCAVDERPCTKKIGAVEIVFDIKPKPVKAMRELSFAVTLKGTVTNRLILDLGMPGMYMGKNEVVLEKTADGIYTGKGVIPRCPSGKRLWRAKIINHGKTIAEFLFNVSS